jgi:methyl-accepting chemotaxis protein
VLQTVSKQQSRIDAISVFTKRYLRIFFLKIESHDLSNTGYNRYCSIAISSIAMNAHTGFFDLNRLGIAAKLNLVLVGALLLLFILGTSVLTLWLTRTQEVANVEALHRTNRLVLDMFDVYSKSLEHAVTQQERALGLLLTGNFELDTSQSVELSGKSTPLLTLNGDTQNGNFASVDRYTAATGVVATVFARQGDDFVRVTTSLKKEDGSRAVGTPLGASHPAHAALLRGDAYTGKAKLFGRDFMTHYRPLKNSSGEVIAALFTGLDFTEGLKDLKSKVLALKIGDTGYVYALDAGKDKGVLTLHPALEGKNILDAKDASGHAFIQEIVDKKQGLIHYPWANAALGEKHPRDKIVAYDHFEKWNWVIASGSYQDEFSRQVAAVQIRTVLGGLILAAISGLLVYYSSNRWISRPLRKAIDTMDRIAQGDLTVVVQPESGDEVGQLLTATGDMADHLRTAIDEIRRAADNLETSAARLAKASDQVASGSETQSQAAEAMAASVEEMTASIQQVADHSHQAGLISTAAGSTASEGAVVIEHAAVEMANIANSVKQASQTVLDLGRQSEEISTIVNTIKDIADQTNLLALNAAIEAARAGEQGRGFAVVADEVRKLAERTAKSTQEIANMINGIQAGTREAVSRMETGVGQVEEGVNLAHQAGLSIARIKAEATQVADSVEGIAVALREQTSASSHIASNVSHIVTQAETNFAKSRETAMSAGELQNLAHSLKGSVARFHV